MSIEEVVIRSYEGSSLLRLHSREFTSSGGGNRQAPLDYFTTELRVDGLQATHRVYAYANEGLARLFEQMAEEWRGWSGRKEWGTVEGDLEVSCAHDGLGHIEATVTLRPLYEQWSARGTLRLEAGALDRLARDVHAFLVLPDRV